VSASLQLRTQARYSLLAFWRNPAATFFTVALPLIMLLLFTSIFGNETLGDTGARLATFYVPGILALSVISDMFVATAIRLTFQRERRLLKRVRGTPLRPSVFLAGEMAAGLAVMVLMTVLVVVVGWIFFDVSLTLAGLPNLIVSLVVGAASFAALGLALTAVIPNENAAPAITNMIVLPLYFVSDVFIVSTDDTPRFVTLIGDIFPVKHLANALTESFNPFIDGTPMAWDHLAVVAGWGVFGVFAALRFFRWTPR